MQRISAEPVPKAVVAYPNAARAIRAGARDNSLWVAKTGVAHHFGQTIAGASWAEDRVLIQLVSGNVIGISCDESGVICRRLHSAVPLVAPDSPIENSAVELVLKNIFVRWDRGRLINNLAGKTLCNMQMSGSTLFLYASELPIICFGTMRNRDTGRLFLFWSESD